MFSPLTQQLIDDLCCLPGVGKKTAQRMAFNLLAQKKRSQGSQLGQTLLQAMENVGYCQSCQTYSEQSICEICANPKRQQHTLCVVESPADIAAIEQTHRYKGVYFVLHGRLSPLDGIGPQELGIPLLIERIQQNQVTEVILASNPTMEGKATAHYIASQLNQDNITISRIAFGVPLGGEIEYLDGNTLAHAFSSRRPFSDQETL